MLHKWNCDTGVVIMQHSGDSFIRFQKAFNLIDHHILIQKLVSYEIPSNFVNQIIDFLLNRKQRVKRSQN